MEISEAQLAQIKRKRILIVDDLPQNLQVLGNTLREYGFQIAFATSGKQALNVAELKLPHLILLDMSMPEMDGITVCKKLKENFQTKSIPVVFLTARTEAESIMKAMKAGGTDYVVKPFNTDDLLARILYHLGLDKVDAMDSSASKASGILDALSGEFMEKWKDVKTGLFIDEVIEFAKSLKDFGAENEIKALVEYGQDLLENADKLNIEIMTEILEQYPFTVKKIILQ